MSEAPEQGGGMTDNLGVRLQKAAADHCKGLDLPHDLGLVLLQQVFVSDGNEEARWIEHEQNSCPYCGGSGHKDDVKADSQLWEMLGARDQTQAVAALEELKGQERNQ